MFQTWAPIPLSYFPLKSAICSRVIIRTDSYIYLTIFTLVPLKVEMVRLEKKRANIYRVLTACQALF